MVKTLKVLEMSALKSQAPWPAKRMRVMVWLIVAYCMEESCMKMAHAKRGAHHGGLLGTACEETVDEEKAGASSHS